jgi:hypothetical protein
MPLEAARQKVVNRSAAPAPAPAARVVHARVACRAQTALAVSAPRDPAEREAESTARHVMRMPAPAGADPIRGTIRGAVAREAATGHTQGDAPAVRSGVAT